MHKTLFHHLILVSLGLLMIVLVFWAFHLSRSTSQFLGEALSHYEEAVQAPNVIQREAKLNQALRIYASLEDQFNPRYGNGKLYNNMGLIYFESQQYPWAALYFYQASALMPRDPKIAENLRNTLQKLPITTNSQTSIFKKVFFFHYYLSLPERLQILTACTLLILGLASLYLWKHYRFLKGMIAAVLLIWTLFLGSVLFTKYVAALEGLLIQDAMLYRDARETSAFVTSKPIYGGHRVEVLDVKNEGKWLKVRTDEGLLGYVRSDSMRILK